MTKSFIWLDENLLLDCVNDYYLRTSASSLRAELCNLEVLPPRLAPAAVSAPKGNLLKLLALDGE